MTRPLRFIRFLVVAALAATLTHAAKTPPRPLVTFAPEYPVELLDELLEGKVVVEMIISTEGRVKNPVIKSSDHDAFTRETLKVLDAWEFEPAKRDGVPVNQRVNLPFNFKPDPTDLLNKRLGRNVYVRLGQAPVPLEELRRPLKAIGQWSSVYPAAMQGSGEEKTVRVQFVVGGDGKTYNPELLDNVDAIWAMAAIATVVGMEFEPVQQKGKPVSVLVIQDVLISEGQPSSVETDKES